MPRLNTTIIDRCGQYITRDQRLVRITSISAPHNRATGDVAVPHEGTCRLEAWTTRGEHCGVRGQRNIALDIVGYVGA